MKYIIYIIHETKTVYLESVEKFKKDNQDNESYSVSLGVSHLYLNCFGIAKKIAELIALDNAYNIEIDKSILTLPGIDLNNLQSEFNNLKK